MKFYYFFRAIFFVTSAILIGIFSIHLLDYLYFLVSGTIILYGVEGIFMPISRNKKRFFEDYQFYLGIIEIILGFVMLFAVREFSTICVMWGTWTIVRESYELYETGHKFIAHFPAFFSLILSIVEIVFSILLIIYSSEHHALTHIYLLIPEFIIIGLSPLLFYIYEHRFMLHKNKK